MDKFKYSDWILTGPTLDNAILYISDPSDTYQNANQFVDGKSRPTFFLDVGACQGNVLGNAYASYTRYALVIPTSIYKKGVDYVELYTKWIEFLQLFNPDIKLHILDDTTTIANALKIPNISEKDLNGTSLGAWSFYLDKNYWTGENSWPAYSGVKGIHTMKEFMNQTKDYLVVEFPSNDLRGITVTLARYLSRSQYQAIPKLVLDLYNHGIPPVAALYIGHYATIPFIWTSRSEFLEFTKNLTAENVAPGKSVLNILPKKDFENEEFHKQKNYRYANYYGLVAPHVVQFQKLLKLSVPDFLKLLRNKDGVKRPINGILLPQEQLYMKFSGGYSTMGIGSRNMWTTTQAFKGLEGIKILCREIVDPVYELVESANTKSLDDFLADVERISNKIYEASNNTRL